MQRHSKARQKQAVQGWAGTGEHTQGVRRVAQISSETSSNLGEFVIMDVIEIHDTSVMSLCCSSLADDSDTTSYHFLTSVITTLTGKEAQSIPHAPGFCPLSPLSAEVEPETSCSHSDARQSCTQVMKAAAHMCTLIYGLSCSDTVVT